MSEQDRKTVEQSRTISTEIVLPNDTNSLGYLRGGRLMHWMDIASVITAQKHARSEAVTITVDRVHFRESIQNGDVVTIDARLTRVFGTSMEIKVQAWGENIPEDRQGVMNSAYFTFVAIDKDGEPLAVPKLHIQTEAENQEYEKAERRRIIRLLEDDRIQKREAMQMLDNLDGSREEQVVS